jgi:TetR/AcrR family transcriptional repressor of nem operon
MARPREFDTTRALEQAMRVFWAQGFEATSLCDLLGAMGLSKSSLYETFGSKHELYLAALDHYNRTVTATHVATVIAAHDSPKAGIAAVFEGLIDSMLKSQGGCCGCFVTNSAVEVAPRDPAAARRVCNGLDHVESAFCEALGRARAAGEISDDRDPQALARYLNSSLNGLMVMAKARPERGALNDVARIVLQALD